MRTLFLKIIWKPELVMLLLMNLATSKLSLGTNGSRSSYTNLQYTQLSIQLIRTYCSVRDKSWRYQI